MKIWARLGTVLCASSAAMGQVSAINGMKEIPRYFNDRPGSNLAFENVYPSLFRITEDTPGPGGFANGHMGAFSADGGADAYNFNYGDAFDTVMTMNVLVDPVNVGGEAGFKFNLFGIGHFGVLPHNGEIAAFGGILPFHSFGVGLWAGQDIDLRIIHTRGMATVCPAERRSRPRWSTCTTSAAAGSPAGRSRSATLKGASRTSPATRSTWARAFRTTGALVSSRAT